MKKNFLLFFIIVLLDLIASVIFSLPTIIKGFVIGVSLLSIVLTYVIYVIYNKIH